MRIIADTHCHSKCSHDGIDTLEAMCKVAINKGLKILSTSEHLFLDPRDVGFGFFDLEAYLTEVHRCRKTFAGQLDVLAGVEFSETHLYQDDLVSLKEAPLDVIVGALHWLDVGFFGDPDVLREVNKAALTHNYYQSLFDMVDAGGFDTLAHMDLIKRYIKVDEAVVTEAMTDVLKSLVSQNIALEMNTSTIRRDGLETAASFALVDAYLNLGGQRLTIGSDAHCSDDLAGDFNKIPKRFEPYLGYYRNRTFVHLDTF